MWAADLIGKWALSLTPADALAALDRVRAEERERCAKVAHDAWMDGVPVAEIAAAIRAMEGK